MNQQNLIISSWPASGGTTMALMLAQLLKYKYVYGGGLLKYFAKEIFGADSGQPHMQFEREYGAAWDKIWEAYAEWLLHNRRQLLVEGMTAGFLYNNANSFAVMYKASLESRLQRSEADGRENSMATLQARDEEVRQRWIKDFGIDIYDEALINRSYELVIDSSEIGIAETLKITVERLQQEGFEIELQPQEAEDLVEAYAIEGKEALKQKLRSKRLLIEPVEVFADWWAHFPEFVKELPEAMQLVIEKTSD